MKPHLKPQDVLVAIKLASQQGQAWTQPQLARELFLSASEVCHSLKRLEASRLYNPLMKRIVRPRLYEFLVHGLPYVFPTSLGVPGRGLPTGISAAPLKARFIKGAEDEMIWEHPNGSVIGRCIDPLYKSVPKAAAADPLLHQWLALVDAIRIGRARERQAAEQELYQWLRT
jgi:hypothetical protein